MFVVAGESLVDMLPIEGSSEREAKAGGSPYNCAIALSKLGNETGFLCPISKDRYGDMLLGPLVEAGVNLLLPERVEAPTTEAIITFDERNNARYRFERGADRAFTHERLLAALPEQIELFEIGGFCPIEAKDAAIWLEVAREAAARGAVLTMDPNVRPQGLDFASYKPRLSAFLDIVGMVKVSIEDLAALDRSAEVKAADLTPEETEAIVSRYVEELLRRPHMGLVVVTFGEEGSRAFTRAGSARADVYPAVPFGDTVGAGDSLMAGVLSWLKERGALRPAMLPTLDSDALAEMLRFGAVVAGLNCQRIGCVPPTRAEVDAALAGR
jgi:fructokinase